MEKNGEKKNVVSRSALLHAQNKKKKKKEKVRACVYSNAESNRGPFANSIISLRFEREKANDFNCVKRT